MVGFTVDIGQQVLVQVLLPGVPREGLEGPRALVQVGGGQMAPSVPDFPRNKPCCQVLEGDRPALERGLEVD